METMCQDIQDQLPTLIGQPDTDNRQTLQKHTSSCASCSDYLKALHDDDRLIEQFVGDLQAVIEAVRDKAIYEVVCSRPEQRKRILGNVRKLLRSLRFS
jgi:hypothetical protein